MRDYGSIGIARKMKNTIELVEKLLLILTLVIGLGVSIYQGLEYLSAKSAVVNAKAAQEQETVIAQQLLTKTYAQILTHLHEDIRAIDNELMKESYRNTVNWEK